MVQKENSNKGVVAVRHSIDSIPTRTTSQQSKKAMFVDVDEQIVEEGMAVLVPVGQDLCRASSDPLPLTKREKENNKRSAVSKNSGSSTSRGSSSAKSKNSVTSSVKSLGDWKTTQLNLNMIGAADESLDSDEENRALKQELTVIMEEQKRNVEETVRLLVEVTGTQKQAAPVMDGWYYTDCNRKKQGPFTTDRMIQWFSKGFFPMECWVKPPATWVGAGDQFPAVARSVMVAHRGYAPICLLFPETGSAFKLKKITTMRV